MGKRDRHQRDRRSANVTSSRPYVVTKVTTYSRQPRRLHVSPSPRAPRAATADHVLRALRRPTPPIADNRYWKPIRFSDTIYAFDGRPAGRIRLHDAPRGSSVGSTSWSQKHTRKQARQALAQVNRFGPELNRQTKAILAFHTPQALPLCRTRQERREVMHAKGIAGGQVRRPRRKPSSGIHC